MRAVHWLRSKQEKQELAYWLSYVAYNMQDNSLSNRFYLVYLLLFFSTWFFIVLVFFAGGGALLLTTLNPAHPAKAAVLIFMLVIMVWWVFKFLQALKVSPVQFSEEDALLMCQTPLRPSPVTLRWLALPSIISAIPFGLLAVLLGFSLAESELLAGVFDASKLLSYGSKGLHALWVTLPFHLLLFVLTWIIGVLRLNMQKNLKSLLISLAIGLVITGIFLVILISSLGFGIPGLSEFICGIDQQQLNRVTGIQWILVMLSLLILYAASKKFSLSRSAEQTKELVSFKSLVRYGFASEAQELKQKIPLGIARVASWQPTWQGALALTWKDIIQSMRLFGWAILFDLVFILLTTMGFLFLTDLASQVFLSAAWSVRIAEFSTKRLRNDLSRWVLFKQLAIDTKKRIVCDVMFSSMLLLSISLVGLLASSAISGRSALAIGALLPGMVLSVAGISAYDIFRRAQSTMLMRGNVPDIAALTIILSTVCAALPVVLTTGLEGVWGNLLGVLTSLVLAGITLNKATRAYHYIGI